MPTTLESSPTTDQRRVRLAVAQISLRSDPTDAAGFAAAGQELIMLMRQAHDAGASVVLFPEAAFCFPDKHQLSSDPEQLAEADWTRFEWKAQQDQLELVVAEARRLRLWTVVGALVPATGPGSRPQTCLLVIDPTGHEHRCYAERLLSRTKQTFLYTAGKEPVTFEVDGIRFGCASGLEVLFPELFGDYEADGVDCVLYGTAGPGPRDREPGSLLRPAATNAQLCGLWVAYATSRDDARCAVAGVVAPGGTWVARAPEGPEPGLAVTDVTPRPDGAPRHWRRETAAGYRAGRG